MFIKTEPPSKPKIKPASTNTKTIKSLGSTSERIAQACDRCRAKKTRCDGRNPCTSCSSVGLECIVSDKLSRRAYPKGYTETLEERIRQLEIENKKLTGLLDIRDEQLELLNKGPVKEEKNTETFQPVTLSNLSRLETENHHHDNCPCGCSNPNAVHERPVSLAGSVYAGQNGTVSIAGSINLSDDDEDSLLSIDDINDSQSLFKKQFNQESPAPGAFAAATAIAQMQKNKVFQQQQQKLENENDKQLVLTSLVAISMPRSTEETLFIPTLLARVCQAHGYKSKTAILTANALASLKENSNDTTRAESTPSNLLDLIMNRNEIKLDESDAIQFISEFINLPTSRMDLDHLITVYFQDWRNALPIIDKNSFLKNYDKITGIMELRTLPTEKESSFEPIEKFGAIMVLILSLSLLSNKHSHMSSRNTSDDIVDKYASYLHHYDQLIHEFIKPNCIITRYCSIQSLQILSLALQYCLVIGDITTCHELRGRVITMAQQLRLHRCPAAVLGISGDNGDINLQNFMQGERRILFWCVYCLDIYSSLNLGVPRLFKDFEIECAMPFSGKNDDEHDDNENILIINNQRLSIVGKVSKFALSFITYSKVLGSIMDSMYNRFATSDAQSKALHQDRLLECWRRELPAELKFEIDLNGFSVKDSLEDYNKQQITLIFLYHHAKILIYLPIMSKYGNHHNVGLSQKEQLTKGEGDRSSIVTSISMIQQSSIQILEVLRSISKYSAAYVLPIPINIAREQARFALLVAKGNLDYVKNGPLYQNLKQLLLDTIRDLSVESSYDIPSSLTRNSVKLIELSILSIIGLNIDKTVARKKVSQPITKTAVAREPVPAEYNKSPLGKINVSNNQPLPVSMEVPQVAADESYLDVDSMFKFDPFKVNFNRDIFMNEFVADGSLGLVPFLGGSEKEPLAMDLEPLANNFFDWL